MDTVTWVIVLTAIAGIGGTGLGGLVGAVLRRDSNKVVSLLLGFAGGVMLAVVCFDLIMDAITPDGAAANTPIGLVIMGIIAGYAVIYVLNYFIDNKTDREVRPADTDHPQTADDLDELIHSDHLKKHRDDTELLKTESGQGSVATKAGYYQLFIAGVVMACAIALHNLPEGMVIGAAYAGTPAGTMFTGGGMVVAIVIGLHNIPEGMAVSVPLIAGGMKRSRAVLITALSGAPTVIGALLGYWLGTMGPIWLSFSLSFASGAMLYVVLGELLPEAILMWRSKIPAIFMLIGILTGLVIIYA